MKDAIFHQRKELGPRVFLDVAERDFWERCYLAELAQGTGTENALVWADVALAARNVRSRNIEGVETYRR